MTTFGATHVSNDTPIAECRGQRLQVFDRQLFSLSDFTSADWPDPISQSEINEDSYSVLCPGTQFHNLYYPYRFAGNYIMVNAHCQAFSPFCCYAVNLSSPNCSVIMSPYGEKSDIVDGRADEVEGGHRDRGKAHDSMTTRFPHRVSPASDRHVPGHLPQVQRSHGECRCWVTRLAKWGTRIIEVIS